MLAEWILAAAALGGHWALAIYFITRLHATGWEHRWLKAIDWVWLAIVPAVPVAVGWGWLTGGTAIWPRFWGTPGEAAGPGPAALAAEAWLAICWLAAAIAAPWWLWERWQAFSSGTAPASSRCIDLVAESDPADPLVSGFVPRLLAALPLNESLHLEVNTKEVPLARLPAALDGLSIVHLSDLHLTGKLTPAFYRRIIREANALGGDLIAITGDIVERDECLAWLDLFAELAAPLGVYFVLGNHDLRVSDPGEVRRRLAAAGLIDLGPRGRAISHAGHTLALAGNEAPWFPADDAARATGSALGILLAHSPDQIEWARARDFDLMLAGHMHGGQVTFPLLGPLIAPSRYGVYYAEGLFAEPPTTLHVSRGIAALHPFRFGARPELTKLVLRAASPQRPF